MIRVKTYIVCDACGNEAVGSVCSFFPPPAVQKRLAETAAQEIEGWFIGETGHYCPDCKQRGFKKLANAVAEAERTPDHKLSTFERDDVPERVTLNNEAECQFCDFKGSLRRGSQASQRYWTSDAAR